MGVWVDIAVQWCKVRPEPVRPYPGGFSGPELYRRMILGERSEPTRWESMFGKDVWGAGLMEQFGAGSSTLMELLGPPPERDVVLPKHFLPMTTTYRWPGDDFSYGWED